MSWVKAGMPYCGALPGEPDFLCGMSCDREVARSASWDAYRSDCSGLVSFSWGLDAPGLVTRSFHPKRCRRDCVEEGFEIPVAELRPGDALNRWPQDPASSPVGHIRLFGRWVDDRRQIAELIEEHGCGGSARRFRARFDVGVAGPVVVELAPDGSAVRDLVPSHPIRHAFSRAPCGSPAPGHFPDGSTGAISDAFWLAFVAGDTNDGDGVAVPMGCPLDDVHGLHGLSVQHLGPSTDVPRSSDLQPSGALVYDDGARPVSRSGPSAPPEPAAHLVRGELWRAWSGMKAGDGRDVAGPLFLGAPTTDELPGTRAWSRSTWCRDPALGKDVDVSAGGQRRVARFQCFERGYMWTETPSSAQATGKVHVHVGPLIDGTVPDESASPAQLVWHVAPRPPGERPPSGTLFRIGTGSTVYLAQGDTRHAFASEECFRLLHDESAAIITIPAASAETLIDGAMVGQTGTYYRRQGSATVYRLDASGLRPLCGPWTAEAMRARAGVSPGSEILVDEAHWPGFIAAHPVAVGRGVLPPGVAGPRCGDPGFECGVFPDPDGGLCRPTLDCGPCPPCGDGSCNVLAGEDCLTCPQDCGRLFTAAPGNGSGASGSATTASHEAPAGRGL